MIPEYEAHESNRLKPVIWLGKKDNEWPITVFEDAGAAQRWQADTSDSKPGYTGRVRRIWELSTESAVERRVIVVPSTLFWDGEGTP